MKTTSFKVSALFVGVLLILGVAVTAIAQSHNPPRRPHQSQAIPTEIVNYVEKYFGNERIVEVEQGPRSRNYEIELANGVDLKFDSRYNCYEADGESHNPLPAKLVKDFLPKDAYKYLKDNNLIDDVESIKRESRRGYEVELTNRHQENELHFDADGNLLSRYHD